MVDRWFYKPDGKQLMCAVVLATALAAGGCARNDPVLDDPRLARMSPEQRLQVLKQIYEIRRGVVEAERGWDNTPLRTPQAMEKNEREFPSPTYCTTTGPYSYRTTVCN